MLKIAHVIVIFQLTQQFLFTGIIFSLYVLVLVCKREQVNSVIEFFVFGSVQQYLIIQWCLEFSEPINLIDVYGVLQRKHPDFSNQDLRKEIATLLVTVSAIQLWYTTMFG